MKNRLALMVSLGVVYAGVATAVVHQLGASYRRELMQRQAAITPPGPAEPPITPNPPPKVAVVTVRKANDSESVITTPSPPIVRAPTTTPPVSVPTPPVVATTTPATPRPAVATPDPVATPSPAAPTLPPLIIPGIAELSPKEEEKYGKLLHMLILSNHDAEEDSPYERSVMAAARPVIDMRERKDLDVKVTVLDSDDVNAFSHLGGYIYMSRGLFSLAASEEEFRFVVAHELAHLDLRHAQARVAEATRQGKVNGVGTLAALYHQVAEGYTEAQENAADDYAVDRMIRLGHSKRETLAFLRRLVGHSEEKGYRNGRRAPKTDVSAPVQDVENHYKSHPAAWKRKERADSRFTRAEKALPPEKSLAPPAGRSQ